MSLEELSKFTITQKYSKYIPELNRRETWDEVVNRSLNMHLRKFDNLESSDKTKIEKAFDLVREKRLLPSMRGMQFAGAGVERKNERQFNCCFLHVYNTRAIEKAFYLLLCGVGCGFGLRQTWVDKFPEITKEKNEALLYTIDDSIEGWAISARVLIDSYLQGNEWTGKQLKFDYSHIRPEGSPISHGGVAPGPDGLRKAHRLIEKLLRNTKTPKLQTIDVYDILMHIADAVLSGGIRRAATIALFDKTDQLMLTAKTGQWYVENPQRARSNNTVLLLRSELLPQELHDIIENTRQWGEPGFALVDDLNVGTNPCAEVGLNPFFNGVPAVQFCNLVTINGTTVNTVDDLKEVVEAAAIIGTIQASYTDFKFLDKEDVGITELEALLGISILGHMANPDILLNGRILSDMAQLATTVNRQWATKLGINPAARITCTKPDGNSSCVLESAYSGIHPAHAPMYIRRVRINKNEPLYEFFKKKNPELCEPAIGSDTDAIISFPIEVDTNSGLFKSDLTAIEHLEYIKLVQQSWVNTGKTDFGPANHAVSCTVLVNEDEWEDVSRYIFDNKENFTNVSLLPRTGDKDYQQAPYEAVSSEEDYERWISLRNNFKPVDYTEMHESTDNTSFTQELSCVGGVCAI